MKKLVLSLLLICFSQQIILAQVEYTTIPSTIMEEDRKVKIQLPRSYNQEKKKKYPIFIVMDGEYLFEPFAGMIDYLSYWEEIPEAIVVGVMQQPNRELEMQVDDETFLPFARGEDFFDFLELELLPHISENYRTSLMSVVAGHSLSANFMNFFLFRKETTFQGYINLSPRFTNEMTNRIKKSLKRKDDKIWYYLSNGTDENKEAKKEIKDLTRELQVLNSEKLSFLYDEIKDATLYTMVAKSIPNALDFIFTSFKPITNREYEDKLLVIADPVQYLEDKYLDISSLYSMDFNIRINDIMFVSRAIEETTNWDLYKDLSKIAKKHHPDTLLESYFLARHYQEIGEPKKALKHYQNAYGYDEVGPLNKELMLLRAEEIKDVFGY